MKNSFLILLLIIPLFSFGQNYNLNSYKYIVISQKGDPLDIGTDVKDALNSYGFKSFISGENTPSDLIDCQALYCELSYKPYETWSQIVNLKLPFFFILLQLSLFIPV